ncbi:MAG: glycosyltransferase family 2 protein [Ilumatobacter sp.]
MPRVSIGLPVYNGEEYLEQSIQSVLAQTYADLELIVADNASTDSTIEIVERFAADDDRVVILRSDENHGAAWNYNRVFDAATGEFFRWHAHDDWFEPKLIERLVDELDREPDAVLAHSTTQFVDDDGTAQRVFSDDLGATSDDPAERVGSVVRRLTYCNAVFGLIRREELANTALIASFPGSDASLLYELAARGRFAVIDEPLFVRRPGNSIKSNPTNRAVAEWFAPSAKGRRFPSLHLFRAGLAGIWRADESLPTRIRTAATFARVFPVEQARRIRRRSRRRS